VRAGKEITKSEVHIFVSLAEDFVRQTQQKKDQSQPGYSQTAERNRKKPFKVAFGSGTEAHQHKTHFWTLTFFLAMLLY